MHIHNIQSLLLIETVVLYYAAPLPHCRAPSCVSTGSSGPGLSPHAWSAQTNIKLIGNWMSLEMNATELNHGSQHCTSFFMVARLFNGTPLIRAQASMMLRCWTGGSPLLEVKQLGWNKHIVNLFFLATKNLIQPTAGMLTRTDHFLFIPGSLAEKPINTSILLSLSRIKILIGLERVV